MHPRISYITGQFRIGVTDFLSSEFDSYIAYEGIPDCIFIVNMKHLFSQELLYM